jgi:nicotinate-nucleotide adenylyltransferase
VIDSGRVAVLGGTFDPIHLGHLAIADQARDVAGFDETWLVPSAIPPHRPSTYASAQDRLDMAVAAVAGGPRLRVLDVEVRRPGPSYTADTLRQLERDHPAVEFWLVLGADAARDIGTWHGRDDLLDHARFLIVNRSGVDPLHAPKARRLGFQPPDLCRIVHVDSPPISATAVRDRVRAGQSLDGLVPAAVAEIIAARGLYRNGDRSGPGGIIERG